MDDAPKNTELKLPLVIIDPSYSYGSSGNIRIADANHRIVCEIVNGGHDMAEMFVEKMNAIVL